MSDIHINDPVGNGLPSKPDDVLTVRNALNDLSIDAGEPDRPYIDKPLDRGIRQFQRENDLKEDGKLHPHGETIHSLRTAIRSRKPIKNEKTRRVIINNMTESQIKELNAILKSEQAAKITMETIGNITPTRRASKAIPKKIKETIFPGKSFESTLSRVFEEYFLRTQKYFLKSPHGDDTQ